MSKAILRGVRLSPKKARLIARQVQGMNAEYALASLEFTPNKAAGIIYKVIASAVANGDYQADEVMVSSCRIDEGAVLKRFMPRARGSASRIRKPTAHILVEVAPEEKKETKTKKVANEEKPKETKKQEPVKQIEEPVTAEEVVEAAPATEATEETTNTTETTPKENNDGNEESTMKKEEQ